MTITVPGQRKPSASVKSFVKDFEKCRLKAFLPTPNDVPTIGWGATGRGIYLGLVWTQRQADDRFERDCAMFAAGVDHLIGNAETTQGQFDAMFSFAYNVGLDDDADTKAEGLGDSSLLRYHKAGLLTSASLEFGKWNKQKGRVLKGLTIRRAQEAAVYRGELLS